MGGIDPANCDEFGFKAVNRRVVGSTVTDIRQTSIKVSLAIVMNKPFERGRFTQTGPALTDSLVGACRRFRRGLSEPGFEACLAKPRVITRNEGSLGQLDTVVTRVRVRDNLARILACG